MNKKSFAIIGNPIAHSLSPVLHNYWFKKYKIEAVFHFAASISGGIRLPPLLQVLVMFLIDS